MFSDVWDGWDADAWDEDGWGEGDVLAPPAELDPDELAGPFVNMTPPVVFAAIDTGPAFAAHDISPTFAALDLTPLFSSN